MRSATSETGCHSQRETIVSLSSGALPAGIAVIRASGPRVRFVVETLAGKLPEARKATRATLRDRDGSALDTSIVLYFPGPASFTGEDVAEFQLHGSRAVVAAVIDRITALDGCRLAEPGEFTRRAFLNGKIDLLAAEATAELISAETEVQRRFAALNGMGGHRALYERWRGSLVGARARIEAELDFSDEMDVPGSLPGDFWANLLVLAQEIGSHLSGFGKAEIVQNGFKVVLIGAPNAGKSSLLNALSRRDVAIVTAEPGTTRDAIDVVLDIDGQKIVLTDTAGLRDADGEAERIGMERSRERARQADLVLLVEDMAEPMPVTGPELDQVSLRIGTKSDLTADCPTGRYNFLLSSKTGIGVDELLEELGRRAEAASPGQSELVPWRRRHVDLLREAERHISVAAHGEALAIELRSEELRLASDALGRIGGHIDVEDMLDEIFSKFCIGK